MITDLLDTSNDRTPIVDFKGQIQGYARYSLNLQVFEPDDTKLEHELDLIEYESLEELIGKKIRIEFGIIRAENIPRHTSSRTFCQYEFLHEKNNSDKK